MHVRMQTASTAKWLEERHELREMMVSTSGISPILTESAVKQQRLAVLATLCL